MLRLSLTLLSWASMAFAEEAVNLEDLGLDNFNPYLYERSAWWLLLPLAILLLCLWHTKKNPRRVKNPFYEEMEYENDNSPPTDRRNVLPFSREGE